MMRPRALTLSTQTQARLWIFLTLTLRFVLTFQASGFRAQAGRLRTSFLRYNSTSDNSPLIDRNIQTIPKIKIKRTKRPLTMRGSRAKNKRRKALQLEVRLVQTYSYSLYDLIVHSL